MIKLKISEIYLVKSKLKKLFLKIKYYEEKLYNLKIYFGFYKYSKIFFPNKYKFLKKYLYALRIIKEIYLIKWRGDFLFSITYMS